MLACRLHGEPTLADKPATVFVTGHDFVQALHRIDSVLEAQNQDVLEVRALVLENAHQLEAERFRSRLALSIGCAALLLSSLLTIGYVAR